MMVAPEAMFSVVMPNGSKRNVSIENDTLVKDVCTILSANLNDAEKKEFALFRLETDADLAMTSSYELSAEAQVSDLIQKHPDMLFAFKRRNKTRANSRIKINYTFSLEITPETSAGKIIHDLMNRLSQEERDDNNNFRGFSVVMQEDNHAERHMLAKSDVPMNLFPTLATGNAGFNISFERTEIQKTLLRINVVGVATRSTIVPVAVDQTNTVRFVRDTVARKLGIPLSQTHLHCLSEIDPDGEERILDEDVELADIPDLWLHRQPTFCINPQPDPDTPTSGSSTPAVVRPHAGSEAADSRSRSSSGTPGDTPADPENTQPQSSDQQALSDTLASKLKRLRQERQQLKQKHSEDHLSAVAQGQSPGGKAGATYRWVFKRDPRRAAIQSYVRVYLQGLDKYTTSYKWGFNMNEETVVEKATQLIANKFELNQQDADNCRLVQATLIAPDILVENILKSDDCPLAIYNHHHATHATSQHTAAPKLSFPPHSAVGTSIPVSLSDPIHFIYKPRSGVTFITGPLYKQGQRMKQWKMRYFAVCAENFLHYKSENDHKPTDVFPLCNAKVQLPTLQNAKKSSAHASVAATFELHLGTRSAPLLLGCGSEELRAHWVKALRSVIDSITPTTSNKARANSAEAGNRLDDYELLSVLGKGNSGKVFLAQCKQTKEVVAIKALVKAQMLRQGQGEIRRTLVEKHVLQNINHPFLVGLQACFQTDEQLFLVMDYVGGGELFYHMAEEGGFVEDRARFYAAEILLALERLHKDSIVYRDLKLENVLLGADGHIKLTDFGLCKKDIHMDSRTRTFCGTPEYMAPEVLLEDGYGLAVDWWCLGILLYEMVAGEPAFSHPDQEIMYMKILEAKPQFPRWFSFKLRKLLSKLLEKDPQKRLGCGERGPAEIREDPFFANIDWVSLERKEIKSPFVPRMRHPRDTSNFSSEFTRMAAVLDSANSPQSSTLCAAEQDLFKGFDATNPLLDE